MNSESIESVQDWLPWYEAQHLKQMISPQLHVNYFIHLKK